MADHLIRNLWGMLAALTTALLTLALIAPAGAQAAAPVPGALSGIGAVVPPAAMNAASAALAQVPSASGTGAQGGTQPGSPPSVPAVPPPALRSVPVVAPPTPQPVPANPAPGAPLPSPAGAVEQSVSALSQSVPEPDTGQAGGTESTASSTARPDRTPRGRTHAHRLAHPRAHHAAGAGTSARPAASTGRAPFAQPPAARPLSPVPVLEATSRRGTQPAAPARHPRSRSESSRGHFLSRGSRPGGAVATSPVAIPLSAAPPPGGAEGSGAGAGGGAAGATAAALLALVGLCILRALSPGLLGLGLTPVQSALLVSRLERPG